MMFLDLRVTASRSRLKVLSWSVAVQHFLLIINDSRPGFLLWHVLRICQTLEINHLGFAAHALQSLTSQSITYLRE